MKLTLELNKKFLLSILMYYSSINYSEKNEYAWAEIENPNNYDCQISLYDPLPYYRIKDCAKVTRPLKKSVQIKQLHKRVQKLQSVLYKRINTAISGFRKTVCTDNRSQ